MTWALTTGIRESTMRRCRRDRRDPSQLQLFPPTPNLKPATGTNWAMLPEPTRQRVTALMIRLLVDHGERAASAAQPETGNGD
jgi:hypothetical protein